MGPAFDGGHDQRGEPRRQFLFRLWVSRCRKQRREPHQFIHRGLARRVLVDARHAEPGALVGHIAFLHAAISRARWEVVVERLGDEFQIDTTRKFVHATGEGREVARGEREPTGRGLIEELHAFAVKAVVHDERLGRVLARRVTHRERGRRVRVEQAAAHRAREPCGPHMRPTARWEELCERRVAFTRDDHFAITHPTVLHAEAIHLPARRQLLARKIREQMQIRLVAGNPFPALLLKLLRQLRPSRFERSAVGRRLIQVPPQRRHRVGEAWFGW